MLTFIVWSISVSLYGAFLAWYQNWRSPLTAADVDRTMAALSTHGAGADGRNDFEAFRQFLLADDEREFYMLNLVRLAPGNVTDPVSGALRPAREVMADYTKVFLPALVARAGHPAIVASKVGPYVDAWGVAADPGWTIVGFMRYRSRRDLAELVADPRFGGAHEFKFAAMPTTFSFPTQPRLMALPGPRITVALVLALLAALVQIVWLFEIRGG